MSKKFECTCKKCVSACKHKPGWFAPGEVEKAAEYLDLTLQDFFDKYLAVDWWEGDPPTFILAPAIIGEGTGSEYPGDPKGQCVFLNNNLCDIHKVKPIECSTMNCTASDSGNVHEEVYKMWIENQEQIVELLGRKPKAKEYADSMFDFLF